MIINKEYEIGDLNLLTSLPDQFVSKKKKKGKKFIKNTLDFFANIAHTQFIQNRDMKENYDLRNGIFDFSKFTNDPATVELVEFYKNAYKDSELDLGELATDWSHLQHYPIINVPINTLVGELAGRPQKERVKALDEESASEVFAYRTGLLKQLVIQNLMASLGNLPPEQQQLTIQEVEQRFKSYTTIAEQWGNKMINVLKSYFNTSEKDEDAFLDYLTTGREYHHHYLNNSPLGFNYVVENPRHVWIAPEPNAKITDDCWAVGTIHVKSISAILEEFKLTEQEIRELIDDNEWHIDPNQRYTTQSPGLPNPTDPRVDLFALHNLISEEELYPEISTDTRTYHVVVRSYWLSKEKIGKVTFIDEEGYQQTKLVNEDYLFSPEYGDVDIEWTWENKWYWGAKIGSKVYKGCEAVEWTDMCPIQGIVNTSKNTKSRGFLDLAKPFQSLYNIVINQIYELLSKEIGNVFLGDLKLVPNKDSDDPLEQALYVAKQRGVLFVDSSVENTGGNISFNQLTNVDLTRSQEIQQRILTAQALKQECWELVGISRQRAASVMATETATGVNAALNQSYAQTEYWFKTHEYLKRRVYQNAINMCQYIELQKPESIINYLTTDLENVFFKINRNELLRDLFVVVSNSSEDKKVLDTLRELFPHAIQNGAELLDIADILTTNSERKIREILNEVRLRKEQFQQQALEQERMMGEQNAELERARLAEETRRFEVERADENMNKQLDRETRLQERAIMALGFDKESEGGSEILTALDDSLERSKQNFNEKVENRKLDQKDRELDLKEKDIEAKVTIAKENKQAHEVKKKTNKKK